MEAILITIGIYIIILATMFISHSLIIICVSEEREPSTFLLLLYTISTPLRLHPQVYAWPWLIKKLKKKRDNGK